MPKSFLNLLTFVHYTVHLIENNFFSDKKHSKQKFNKQMDRKVCTYCNLEKNMKIPTTTIQNVKFVLVEEV